MVQFSSSPAVEILELQHWRFAELQNLVACLKKCFDDGFQLRKLNRFSVLHHSGDPWAIGENAQVLGVAMRSWMKMRQGAGCNKLAFLMVCNHMKEERWDPEAAEVVEYVSCDVE